MIVRTFCVKKCVPTMCSFFSSILGRSEPPTGWAHMQSVHACAVQTHFSVFVLVLKKGSLKNANWVNLGVMFNQKRDCCVKKGVPKTASKKGAPADSNNSLFTGQEAPGEAASRAHCSDKKQLFEQQLRHCSTLLQKKCLGSTYV